MPKQKTKKSVSLRIKVTGTGKCLRRTPGVGHFLSKKSTKNKRPKGKDKNVGGFAETAKYKVMMGL